MATPTAADILIDTLIDFGVGVMFGLPGDGINGIIESLRNRQDRIRFVQVRHEEAAAFMACAYAKWTGRLGCCLATSGPGGIHLLNGLYDAKLDGVSRWWRSPGCSSTTSSQTHTQQDVELDKLFIDVAVYNARIMGPAHMRERRPSSPAARRWPIAASRTSTMPVDMQSMPCSADFRSERNVPNHVSRTDGANARMCRARPICAGRRRC